MRAAHRSKLLIPEGDLEDLALLHCEWALGLDRFAELRESRLRVGVPADARPADLIGDRGGRWLFRFSLPADDGLRTSVVRVSAMGEGIVVEHVVVREGPRERLQPSADSPETVRAILEMPGVRPAALRGVTPLVVGEREVPAIVADSLELHREAPIVLVSVDNATKEPLVSPHELQRRLAGMALVVWLSTVGASRRLKDELLSRGFSDKFGCFHGGVRILWPGINRGDDPYDHLLILPVRLYGIPERIRTERIAGVFCEMIAEDEDLRAWLREVESPPPRPEPPPPRRPAPEEWAPPRSTAARANGPRIVLRPPPTPIPEAPAEAPTPSPPAADEVAASPPSSETSAPAPEVATPASAAAEAAPASADEAEEAAGAALPTSADAEVATATTPEEPAASAPVRPADEVSAPPAEPARRREPEVTEELRPRPRPRPRQSDTTWSRLAADVMAAADLAEELEHDLEATRRELMDARKAQRRAEQERDEAVEARFTADSVADALALAEACFPARLVVLPSARAGAEASPYRDPSRIFESLAILALFGRHDGEFEAALQKALGAQARWRPKDGPETSSRFGGHRTWAGSDGERKLYRRHITVGHGVDPQRCAQIYYDITGDGRVEVAWVGEHRPTVSEDT